MSEQVTQVGDVELCWDSFGETTDPTLLLVMGLGTQMIAWHEDFCGELASRGFHVVRFDNRDNGRSTWFDQVPPPGTGEILLRRIKQPAYLLGDMAGDAFGLLDHLGVERAHVVGASMGGYISQVMAAERPDRVLSLASIMSSTGNRWQGQPALRVLPAFLKRAPADREGYAEHIAKLFGLIGSPGFERDAEEVKELARRSYDRGVSAAATGRQLGAVIASGDRSKDLARVTSPTVVIHGTKDRLVRPDGGRATAKAIAGSQLVKVEGMGHDLPRGAWPQVLDAISANASRAGASSPSSPAPAG